MCAFGIAASEYPRRRMMSVIPKAFAIPLRNMSSPYYFAMPEYAKYPTKAIPTGAMRR